MKCTTIKGVQTAVLKTYANLDVSVESNEVVLSLRQNKGYISPMIIVKKDELEKALRINP